MWTRMSKQSQQQHRRRPTAKRRARRQAFWTAGAVLIVFLFCLPLLPKFFLQESIPTAEPVSTESSSAGSATVSQPEEAEPAPEPEPQPLVQTVRFSATGDNLIHAPIYKQAQRRASGEEAYSFDYCYEHIAPFYAQHDVNWIKRSARMNWSHPPTHAFLRRAIAPVRFTGRVCGCSACPITTPTIKALPALPLPCASGAVCRRM